MESFYMEVVEMECTTTSSLECSFKMSSVTKDYGQIGRMANSLTIQKFYLQVDHTIQTHIDLLGFKLLDSIDLFFDNEKLYSKTGKEVETMCVVRDAQKYGFHQMLEGARLYVPIDIFDDNVVNKITFKKKESIISLEEFLSKISVSFKMNNEYFKNIKKICLYADIIVK